MTTEKNRGWRFPSERRAYHIVQGDESEAEEEVKTSEIPSWLQDMKEVFQEPEGVVKEGRRPHRIRVKEGARAYQKAPYRLSPEQVKVLHEELKGFKNKGWIRPSHSEWATVALVVPKKDDTWRVCIDYRDLNAISEMDAYPLPRIDELFAKLSGARWFTKMDLKAGFHQIPMSDDSIQYTAFRVGVPLDGCSHFEWTVMPMGLSTAPASFQRWMEDALQGLESTTLVYLDDVLVFSSEEKQHRSDVRQVVQRFKERKMRVKLEKSEFAKQEIQFLGHVVSDGKLKVDESKLSKLALWKAPLTTIKQVRQLMGFLSYYRAFMPHFASVTAPLTDLLKGKNKKIEWTSDAEEAMGCAKRLLWDACERYAWDAGRENRVTTDASGTGLGATLEQRIEGVGWAPVAFWSRKMSAAETRYSVTDQEWLAVIDAVTRQWRHWLKGRRFQLRTDHGPLIQILTKKGEEFSNRQTRWLEKLGDFTFEVSHIPGNENKAADALSRAHVVSALEVIEEAKQHQIKGWEEVEKAAGQDQAYQEEIGKVKEGLSTRGSELQGGVMLDPVGRVIVPADCSLRTKLILEAHEPPFCGHFGARKTGEIVSRSWWWPGLPKDVERIVGSCDVCQRTQHLRKKEEAPLEVIVAERPWEVVTIDFLSGFTPSIPGGWQGCIVVCDRFSRMMHVKECGTHPTAKETAVLFLQLVVRAHGVPRKVITDRGTQFESLLWYELMGKMGTRVALATTHHPQTNGLTERMNRTLINMIRKVCAEHQTKWVEVLPLLEFAYNNSPHRVTKVSPFQAVQGTNPIVPASLLLPVAADRPPPKTYAEEVQKKLETVWATMKKLEEAEGQRVKRREDQKRGPEGRIKAGDEVLCRRFQLHTAEGGKRKQELLYDGPFRVARMLKDSVAELEGLPQGAPTMINTQYLRVYRREPEAENLRAREVPGVPLSGDQGTEWEVEAIKADRKSRGRKEFLLKWKGYARPTWVAEKDLTGCKEMLREYRLRNRGVRPSDRRNS